ncbi:DUF3889 domain-containing protein [Brevibacillus dissolubilis]|uniref:DUF3889 domain-containing protein n=1 Tax=Brevibacillus dissolubilis TaxID=1844116 RepID=UPI0021002D54|nr:DUF3889 domain-containing protein [Brevibacillus dissolubilis]
MTRIMTSLLACMLFFSTTTYAHPQQPETPSYAKYGKLAMEETKKHYPNAEITDYRHVGRNKVNATTAKETFKLRLKQNQKEWGVLVNIIFETQTGKTLSIKLNRVNN